MFGLEQSAVAAQNAPEETTLTVEDTRSLWNCVRDPEPGWAASNPVRFMAYLAVVQRDTAAIDELR